MFTTGLASILLSVSSRLVLRPVYVLVVQLPLRSVCRQPARPPHLQECQLAFRRLPRAPHRLVCLKLSWPQPLIVWQKACRPVLGPCTSLSVLAAVSASISAIVGSSVTTGHAAFRSVSVSLTFPAFSSASLSAGVSSNALASTLRSLSPGFWVSTSARL